MTLRNFSWARSFPSLLGAIWLRKEESMIEGFWRWMTARNRSNQNLEVFLAGGFLLPVDELESEDLSECSASAEAPSKREELSLSARTNSELSVFVTVWSS